MQPTAPARPQADHVRFALHALTAIALIGYFILPGWLSASLVLLELASVTLILHPLMRGELASLMRIASLRWMLLAFSAPLIAAAVVEASHHEFSSRHLEGPVRLVLAGTVMLALALLRIDFSRAAAWVFPASIGLCAAWVFDAESTRYFWGGRAATIFMDPITLSQHIVIFAFACVLLLEWRSSQSRLLQAALCAGFVLALAIALRTESRTGWAIVPFGAILLAIKHARSNTAHPARTLIFAAAVLAGAYFFFPEVHGRIRQAVTEASQYFQGGDRDTSVGIRFSLFRTNIILFLQRPWLGWGYAVEPDILSFPAIRELYTPLFGFYWTTAGGHNEYLQSMMRMGVAGLLSRLLLLVVPLALFASAARSADPVRCRNGFLGLIAVVGYCISGIAVEVFNLSYSVSLYALMVSVFAAGAMPRARPADGRMD
jgi:O-antigen ligase